MNDQSIPMTRPVVGVSACLLGIEVRYDGGHKRNHYVQQVLAEYLDMTEVCPESEAGLGTPRPAMHLQNRDQSIRLVISKDTSFDLTGQMHEFTRQRLPGLSHLDGFIFKKDSPSCGLYRVAVAQPKTGQKTRNGQGLFAGEFAKQYPAIPVEEEGRLNDSDLRENFLERVYSYQRWKQIRNPETNVKGFIDFHANHKLMLMARGSTYYQELGRVVAGVSRRDLAERREQYLERFSQVMAMRTSRGRHVNVLQHVMGYLKESLDSEDKQELLTVFEQYRQRQVPLITALTLLRHHLRKFPQPYIEQQCYLNPYPETLALRSVL